MAVVCTANRGITVYMLEGKPQEFRKVDSPLKFQHRAVSIFKDKTTKQPTGIKFKFKLFPITQTLNCVSFQVLLWEVSKEESPYII